jgi:hypothetical protein
MARVYGIDNRAVYSPLAGLAQAADVALGYYQKKQDRNERKNERAEDRKHDIDKLNTSFDHGVGLRSMEFGMGNWRDQQTRKHQVDILDKQHKNNRALNQQQYEFGIARDNNTAFNAETLAHVEALLGQGYTDAQIANMMAKTNLLNEQTNGTRVENAWNEFGFGATINGYKNRNNFGQPTTPLTGMDRPQATQPTETQTPAPTETQPNIFNFGTDLGLGANAPSTDTPAEGYVNKAARFMLAPWLYDRVYGGTQ